MIAFCKTIHTVSLALAKKIWEAIILLHHSHYPKCHLRFQKNIEPNYACCATSIGGAQLHVMFPYKSFLVFSLIAWVTIHAPCSHLSLSMILALTSAMVDVCAWDFCLLQCLCSLRYVDTLLPLSDADIHGSDKLHISLPVVLASCCYPVSSIISVTTVPTRS